MGQIRPCRLAPSLNPSDGSVNLPHAREEHAGQKYFRQSPDDALGQAVDPKKYTNSLWLYQ